MSRFKAKVACTWKLWSRFKAKSQRCRCSIHTLPVEILALIFVFGATDDTMLPVVISHVCRSWRYVALATPRLWRQIRPDYRADMWIERIHRAKACTLDIIIAPPAHASQPLDANSVQWAMHLVKPTIDRWRSLEIRIDHYLPFLCNASLSAICSRRGKARAPCLEELILIYPRNDNAKEFRLFSGDTPRLRRMTVDGVRLAWLPSMFQNLTYLSYTHHGFTRGSVAIQEIICLLDISSRLIELVLAWPRRNVRPVVYPSQTTTLRPVTLPFLRKLQVKVETTDIPQELVTVLSHISTPSLLSFYGIDSGRRARPFPGLQSFLEMYPLPTSTRFLSLEHGWYNDIMIFWLLSRLPDLQQIIVKHLHLPNQIFHVYSSFAERDGIHGPWYQ